MNALDGDRRAPFASICFAVLSVCGLIALMLPWYTSDDRGTVSGIGYASGLLTLGAMLLALGAFGAAVLMPEFRSRSWLLLASTVAVLIAMSSVAFSLLAFAVDYALDGSFDETANNPTIARTPFALLIGLIVALPIQVMASNEIDPQGPGWRRAPGPDSNLTTVLPPESSRPPAPPEMPGAPSVLAADSETSKAAT